MSVHVVVSPYDSGHQGRRMGAGPDAFLKHGIEHVLRGAGRQVATGRVEVETDFPTEVATSLTVAAHVAGHAHHGMREGRVPLVLSGNCSAVLGGVDSMRGREGAIGVLWLDAHGDFNTPETSTTGFLDGMSLAMLTGRCWRPAVTEAMGPWWQPVPEENVVLAGTRDLDGAEAEALRQSRVRHVPGGDGERTLAELDIALRQLAGDDVPNLYVHLDCDVVDTSVGRANRFACPGGLTGPQLERVMRMVRERFHVGAMGISAYDPAFDRDGAVYRAVSGAVRALLA